jgi:D-glucosaminate PTS system EIIB component
MTVELFRIDDRLVHGQVVIGWGKPLGIGFIVLVDDGVAASDWERELYRMGVPPSVDLVFASVADAARSLPAWREDPRRGMVLTADVGSMVALCRAAPPVDRLNLGGIHHKPGRAQRLPYVYLSDEEYRTLQQLALAGTSVTAQDLPTTAPVPLERLG